MCPVGLSGNLYIPHKILARMTYSMGTSGSLVELIRIASEITRLPPVLFHRERYTAEDAYYIYNIAKSARDIEPWGPTPYAGYGNLYSGALGEIRTIEAIANSAIPGILFNNVHLKLPKDKRIINSVYPERFRMTQLDHVLVGEYGIVIIDSKNAHLGFSQTDVDATTRQMDRAAAITELYLKQFIKEVPIIKAAVVYGGIDSTAVLPKNIYFKHSLELIAEFSKQRNISPEQADQIQKLLACCTVTLRTVPSNRETSRWASYNTVANNPEEYDPGTLSQL